MPPIWAYLCHQMTPIASAYSVCNLVQFLCIRQTFLDVTVVGSGLITADSSPVKVLIDNVNTTCVQLIVRAGVIAAVRRVLFMLTI